MNLDDALRDLLGEQGRSGDLRADLLAAAAEAWRRRKANTDAGAVVLAALVDPAGGGLTYRQIHTELGIPRSTAQRWATPPGQEVPGEETAAGE